VGFKGAKRSTSFAAQTCGQKVAEEAQTKGVPAVRVLLKGLGAGRMTAVKGLQMGGLEIVSVTDTTPVRQGLSFFAFVLVDVSGGVRAHCQTTVVKRCSPTILSLPHFCTVGNL
jgi:hypothetical protein